MNLHRVIRIVIIAAITWIILTMMMGCTPRIDQPAGADECENSLGNVACDFAMMDQDGKTSTLYEHHGKIIILDFSAMWCGPCQFAALDADEIVEKYGSENVVYITILVENGSGNTPRLKDLQRWSDELGIDINPVLGGSRNWLEDSGYYLEACPTFYILTPTMVIKEYQRGYRKSAIEAAIENLLPAE